MFAVNMKHKHNQCVLTSTDVGHTIIIKVSSEKLVSMFIEICSSYRKLASLMWKNLFLKSGYLDDASKTSVTWKQVLLVTIMNQNIWTLHKAAATRGIFSFTLATWHFCLMLQGSWNHNAARVVRGRLCDKIAGTMWQNIHRVELLQHVADIGDTWLHMQPRSTPVAEQLWGCQVASASRELQV